MLRVSVGLLVGTVGLNAANIDGKTIIETKCVACHTPTSQGFSRISDQRKTPEAWFMTVDRMQKDHGLVLTKEQEHSVVKYLADTQGLNYEESEAFRYILEKTPNYQEDFKDSLFVEMCARCHSGARVGLQRRPSSEWDNFTWEEDARKYHRKWDNVKHIREVSTEKNRPKKLYENGL